MDLDLKPGWERKALIITGAVVFIILIYAFNPFSGSSNVQVAQDQPTDTVATPTSTAPVVTVNNSTANTTNTTNNNTFQISADVAKNIATGANPGYTAGQPTQGNITVNNTVYSVWIVPITQASISKSVYVDMSTGTIIGNS